MGQFQTVIEHGLFTKIPVHPYLFMFHLDLHHYLWVHVSDMEPYAYQPALCAIWEEANYAAWHKATIGWMSRDIDLYMMVRSAAAQVRVSPSKRASASGSLAWGHIT